jgi:hypothetical protein
VCDSDGFTVTPEGYFDNRADGVFRLKDIKVSGLDLSPIGANYLNSGEGFADDASGLAAAKVAHPGQYWNNTAGAWRPTCDGVVLDFQMYTNNPNYVQYTYDSYQTAQNQTHSGPTGINSPLMWVQETLTDGTPRLVYGSQGMWSYDAAVAYKWNGSYYESNYGTGHAPYGRNYAVNYPENLDVTAGRSDASFDIYTSGNWSSGSVGSSRWAPNSQAISAITVETMNYFQPDSDLEIVDSGYAGVAPGAHYYYE